MRNGEEGFRRDLFIWEEFFESGKDGVGGFSGELLPYYIVTEADEVGFGRYGRWGR